MQKKMLLQKYKTKGEKGLFDVQFKTKNRVNQRNLSYKISIIPEYFIFLYLTFRNRRWIFFNHFFKMIQ